MEKLYDQTIGAVIRRLDRCKKYAGNVGRKDLIGKIEKIIEILEEMRKDGL